MKGLSAQASGVLADHVGELHEVERTLVVPALHLLAGVGGAELPALTQHLPVGADQDGAYRDLVEFALGPVRQREGVAHPLLVVQTGHHSHSMVAGGLPEMS